ncbi:MAG: PD-(D/E)XK nuclease family protein, partial [Lachnospiraceae bacterium]
MALQFVFGGSGSGKSTCVYERIIEHSLREEKQNFFVLVPDQFTMQTQMDLVMKHPKGGIMNIDVLSFGRLAYRILEEAGGSRTPVLDDTGKSLVLRKVAAEAEERLPVLGKNLKRLGYIHEIKSALSEFMQYGIGKTELENMLDYSRMRGSLYGKLKDLSVLYEDFQLYLAERFITMEGTFERLARQLEYSAMIADSVVVLDGFTGFTPIQNQIILQLMKRAKEVIVTLTLDREIIHKEDKGGRVQLFSLSLKTKASLEKMAIEAGCRIYPPILVDERQGRFKSSRILAHLEKQLFRVPAEVYREEADGIRLIEAGNMEEEVRQVCRQIRKLLSQGYCYRDIAVISGDVEAYGSLIEEYFEQYELPFFMDKSRKITLNPFIEYIRSALKVLISDYSEKAVFHYLRSGMTQMEKEDADRLENYVLALGIHGRKSWSSLFVRMPEGENGKEELERLNMLREQLVKEFEGFSTRRETVKVLVEQLYSFLTINHSQEKLKVYEKMFAQTGDRSKEKEYAQIYRLVMELLDQLVSLLGEEKMDWEEFAGILDAGFGEIQVGIIPQAIDRILVGDMERTRLGLVKALFFLGMNEGKVPRLSGKGGILSDLDREFLLGSGQELAPTPRGQMFI